MKTFGKIFNFFVYVLLYAPLLIMIFFSFNSSRSTTVFGGFSLKWYNEFFSNKEIMNALSNTIIVAILSAVIATVLGTVAAVGMYRIKNKLVYGAMNTVTNIPMMNPDIVTGVSLMLLFVFVGKKLMGLDDSLNFVTLLIAHITFNLPYVILNVLPKLHQTDEHLYEAAMDLGCTPIGAFFKVVLPAITPGIISGALMAFTLSIDDFIISYFTTGQGFQTLPLMLYSETRKGLKPDMYALSTILFVSVLVLLIIINVFQEISERKSKGAVK